MCMCPTKAEVVELLGSIYPFHRKAGLDYAMLNLVYENLEIAEYSEGEVIYAIEQQAKSLYIVFSGEIHLLKNTQEGEEVIVRLSSGDFFGYEVLEDAQYRAKAVAVTSVVVLVLAREALIRLASQIREFNLGLRLMYDSYRLAQRVHLEWITPDEVIYFIGRRHTAFLFMRLLAPLLAVGFFVPLIVILSWIGALTGIMLIIAPIVVAGGALLWAGWEYLDWANDYSIITSKRVLFQERVVLLYESRQEEPMTAVLSVSTFSSQIGRLLGFGDVIVYTYAGQIRLQALKDYDQVKFLLQAAIQRSGIRVRQLERKEVEKLIRERLEPRKEPLAPVAVPAHVEPGVLQRLARRYFSNLFRMRFTYGDIAVYRKHWLFLVLNVFPPLLVLLVLIVLLILRLGNVITLFSIQAFSSLIVLGLLVAFGFLLYQYYDWRNDYYEISSDQVLDVYKKPLGKESRQVAPLKNIQKIDFQRKGFFGQLFNFGTVYIRVGETSLTFDDVFNPSEVQSELFKRMAEREYREKQAAIADEKQRLTDWIEIYHKITHGGGESPLSSG